MAPKRWRNDEVECLIQMVKNAPFLYDIKDKKYNDRIATEESWRLITEELPGRKVNECKDKWAVLRSQYRKLWSYGEEQVKQARWIFAESMYFMDDYYREKFSKPQVNEMVIKVEPTYTDVNYDEAQQGSDNEYGAVEFLIEDSDNENNVEAENYETIVLEDVNNSVSDSLAKKRKTKDKNLENEFLKYMELKQQHLVSCATKSAEDRFREHTERATDECMKSISNEMKKLPADAQSRLKILFMQRVHEEMYGKC